MQRELDKILENIVFEHRERKTTTQTSEGEANEDLVDVLLRIQKHGDLEFPLTDNNIKAVILVSGLSIYLSISYSFSIYNYMWLVVFLVCPYCKFTVK